VSRGASELGDADLLRKFRAGVRAIAGDNAKAYPGEDRPFKRPAAGDAPALQLKGSRRFRLRVGEYRIIYSHDAGENVLHLLAVGHRREIYRT
jgi:ParE toxin of type II toxin-antitoxin system, parDE